MGYYFTPYKADALEWAISKLEKDLPTSQEERNYLHELKQMRDAHRGDKRPYKRPA